MTMRSKGKTPNPPNFQQVNGQKLNPAVAIPVALVTGLLGWFSAQAMGPLGGIIVLIVIFGGIALLRRRAIAQGVDVLPVDTLVLGGFLLTMGLVAIAIIT